MKKSILAVLLISTIFFTNADNKVTSSIKCSANSACLVVKDTSNKIIQEINKANSPKQAIPSIEKIVASQFNFNLMTKLALGNNWKLASTKEQAELETLFRRLLIYTYSSALYKFQNAEIKITNESSLNSEGNRTAVISEVTLPQSNQVVKVEYDLAKSNNTWKAYDIKIENASLVTTYRNQFNDIIHSTNDSNSNGINNLIAQLKSKINKLKDKQN